MWGSGTGCSARRRSPRSPRRFARPATRRASASSTRSPARNCAYRTSSTCTVCELHAESTFKIEGMDCREEVAMLERRFKTLPGLEAFSADLMGQRLHVKYDAAKLSAAAIADAVADAGMRAWLEHEEPVSTSDESARRRRLLVWTSAIGLVTGLAVQFFAGAPWTANAFFGVSVVAGGMLTVRRAWTAARVR